MSWESCLYIGEIEHRRMSPVRNEFTYSVAYFYLDLDEIKNIFRFPFLLSYNFPGILSFWRKDYYGDKTLDLKQSIIELVKKQTGQMVEGPIRLLTNISYLGHCFNPVSFYYCFKADGKTLQYVVAEVTNTPWGEKHQHVLNFKGEALETYEIAKSFHVSPFMPMTIDYTWVLSRPEQELSVYMQNRYVGEKPLLFDSTLKLARHQLSHANLIKVFFKYPFITLKTVLAIYYQAVRLYIKGTPFFNHPSKEKMS